MNNTHLKDLYKYTLEYPNKLKLLLDLLMMFYWRAILVSNIIIVTFFSTDPYIGILFGFIASLPLILFRELNNKYYSEKTIKDK